MRAPEHMRKGPGKGLLTRMRREANELGAFYRAPVYLVGSALLDFNAKPRDWDIRVVLKDKDFARRYAPAGPLVMRGKSYEAMWNWVEEMSTGLWTETRWNWSNDCVKRSKEVARRLSINVDFQTMPETYARAQYKIQPRYRLDRFRS